MELKACTPVGPKSVFIFHFIQHNFIRQPPGLSKDQTGMFEPVINYFDRRLKNTFNTFRWLYKRRQIFFIKDDKYYFL